MAYTITYSGGTITIADGTLDTTSTSLSLPGRNYPGYGQSMDQNLVSMLENWASSPSGPFSPLKGQMWYDVANVLLKYNIGTPGSPTWKSIAANGDNVTFNNIVATGNITTTNLFASGTVQGDIVSTTSHFLFSVGSVAAGGTTQGTATALTKDINVVTTSTVGVNDGVLLPVTTGGYRIIVFNQDGVDAVKVYPAGSACINGGAAGVPFVVPAGARIEFFSTSATAWFTMNATYA